MRKLDHYCGKWKFCFAGLLKVYCVWKERAILVLEQERSISQQTHRKGFNLFAYFLGQQLLVQMFVMERCLWAFTVHSPKHFVLLLPLIFVLQWPKQEKALECFTHCINHHFETSNDQFDLCCLFACIFHSLHSYFSGKPATGEQVLHIRRQILQGTQAKVLSPVFTCILGSCYSTNQRPGFDIWLWVKQGRAVPASAPGVLVGWAGLAPGCWVWNSLPVSRKGVFSPAHIWLTRCCF